MSLFAIADLHLSLGTNKPMDVFFGWDNYVQRLTENWNKIITENDTVVIAGDISWAMKLEETVEDFNFINNLPGNKIFVKGNHDYWWETCNKMNNFLAKNKFDKIKILFNNCYEGEDFVICGTRGWMIDSNSPDDLSILRREIGRLKFSLDSAKNSHKEKVVFLHYPPIYGDMVCKEIIDVLKEYDVKKCFYGHIHGANMIKGCLNGEYEGITFKLISCDGLSFMPYLVR